MGGDCAIYAWRIEIEAHSEKEARERAETLIAQEGMGDLEGVYECDEEEE